MSAVPHRIPPVVVRAFSRMDPWVAREIVTTTMRLTPEEHVEVDRVLRQDLAEARAALAAAVKAQDPDRHFRGLPKSPEVIAAYDAVRDAEAAVARLEREGRTS
ncbi:hypothetical protein [Lichenibacterium dinghuense]|uniref:hypothetical protein n=1 Tax=Lichenibacterium dinghuense TaxID=2895977 RepID=UPI001F4118C7|nr:hypothetical protein [Lichenibacterium sp. 6Y81]